eukprot:5479039-Pleurochrysis_carterae.AAC.1
MFLPHTDVWSLLAKNMPLPSTTVSTLATLYPLPRRSSQRSISQSRRCRQRSELAPDPQPPPTRHPLRRISLY